MTWPVRRGIHTSQQSNSTSHLPVDKTNHIKCFSSILVAILDVNPECKRTWLCLSQTLNHLNCNTCAMQYTVSPLSCSVPSDQARLYVSSGSLRLTYKLNFLQTSVLMGFPQTFQSHLFWIPKRKESSLFMEIRIYVTTINLHHNVYHTSTHYSIGYGESNHYG